MQHKVYKEQEGHGGPEFAHLSLLDCVVHV